MSLVSLSVSDLVCWRDEAKRCWWSCQPESCSRYVRQHRQLFIVFMNGVSGQKWTPLVSECVGRNEADRNAGRRRANGEDWFQWALWRIKRLRDSFSRSLCNRADRVISELFGMRRRDSCCLGQEKEEEEEEKEDGITGFCALLVAWEEVKL